MDNWKILLGLGSIGAMVVTGIVLLGQIGKEAVSWQGRQIDQVSQAVGVIDGQLSEFDEAQLDAAWARGDERTAQLILQNMEQREAVAKALEEEVNKARWGAPPPEPEAAAPAAMAVPEEVNPADQMANLPFLAAAAVGTIFGVFGLAGALIILRMDSAVEVVESVEAPLGVAPTPLTPPTPSGTKTGHTLNERSRLREALTCLRDAEALLGEVERQLETAARSWTGGKQNRAFAAGAFKRAILALADGGITVDSAMVTRADQWPQGRRSADELRAERDDVIALLGLVRFMLAQERA